MAKKKVTTVKTTTRKPALTGQALAVTRGKGKKKGLKKRGY